MHLSQVWYLESDQLAVLRLILSYSSSYQLYLPDNSSFKPNNILADPRLFLKSSVMRVLEEKRLLPCWLLSICSVLPLTGGCESTISGVSGSLYLLLWRTSFLRLFLGRKASGEGDMSSSSPSNSWLYPPFNGLGRTLGWEGCELT